MSGLAAVIIDTVSIQSYIFSSNKLKENVGASYLVKKIYEESGSNSVFVLKTLQKKNLGHYYLC
jgi:hypothetical protein